VASLLANQPPPAGRRVAIVTNAGGPGIMCADACEAEGLDVVSLPEGVRSELQEFLAPGASAANPVDMLATASAEDYERAILAIGRCDEADAIIVIFIPPLVTRAEDVAARIRAAVDRIRARVPVLAVFMSHRGVPEALQSGMTRIPSYAFPEDAARALACTAHYSEWRQRPASALRKFDDVRATDAASVIAAALAEGPRWLEPHEVATLLDCYGIPLIEWRLVTSPSEARDAAAELGGDVALKAVAPGLLHKSEVGAVRLALSGGDAVEGAAIQRSDFSCNEWRRLARKCSSASSETQCSGRWLPVAPEE
jgi:acyl-CoA synthetase (NDP forming)